MAERYVVAKGRCLMITGSKMLTEGTILKDGIEKKYGITKEECGVLVAKGTLIPLDEATMAKLMGGAEPPKGEPTTSPSPWNVDPKTVVGKKLEEVNAAILAKDETVTPFDTIEEAIAFLTQDFGK